MPRTIIGLLGQSRDTPQIRFWNALFRERSMDAFCDFYRTNDGADLELRLSEMFLHHRRGYVLSKELQPLVVPLLDRTEGTGSVDTVVNQGGVLIGCHAGNDAMKSRRRRFELWFTESASSHQTRRAGN